jgi:hypothetical protein
MTFGTGWALTSVGEAHFPNAPTLPWTCSVLGNGRPKASGIGGKMRQGPRGDGDESARNRVRRRNPGRTHIHPGVISLTQCARPFRPLLHKPPHWAPSGPPASARIVAIAAADRLAPPHAGLPALALFSSAPRIELAVSRRFWALTAIRRARFPIPLRHGTTGRTLFKAVCVRWG